MFSMALTYAGDNPSGGKTTDDTDVFEARFIELVPGERVVMVATFVSDVPAFAGDMTINWRVARSGLGSLVTFVFENVPAGISEEDHRAGLNSSLENLAALVE